ncbi:enhancer of split mgamma protein-like protein [Daphnia sinensis]|uniref:Enhancer of split mgamma protein-like protein n=1 Tax=Daphnia sinensis TaxID=1820382 RepID=A0AAD5KMY0_9CRUS|nr:enhancer of split mgamma protein-like protein [Daphnia sinensis]
MASTVLSNVEEEQPISRTYQYRKVMKPMLERKRRARINRCLDELKELMSSALASEGENLTKLEKADVLELTVRHLHKLRERQALGLSPSPSSPASTQDKFRAGFTHCAAEVSRYLATSTGLDVTVGQRLLSHLGRCVHQLEAFPTSAAATIPSASYTPPSSPTQQQQSELRSIHRSSVLPPLPVSPALSDVMDTTTGPCDYSKYSIRSDLYSPSVVLANVSEKVWRPWCDIPERLNKKKKTNTRIMWIYDKQNKCPERKDIEKKGEENRLPVGCTCYTKAVGKRARCQITKPLLERQRRARINRCLDELKELMSAALAAEGENLTKLEKADVLELTVRHLHQLHREGELSLNASGGGVGGGIFNRPPSGASTAAPADRRRYQGGFLACAQQVASYVMKTPGLEPGLGQRLLAHLARCSQQISPESATLPPSNALGLAGLPPPPQPEANFAAAFPSLTLPADYHASAAREYSITAQFQVYRPPVAPQPLRVTPDMTAAAHPAEANGGSSDESTSPGSKRRASPDFPHIPKKRYAHFNFEAADCGRVRTESESEPVASTSTAPPHPSDCYVVESQIVQLSPRPPSSADGKDSDSMWRPW